LKTPEQKVAFIPRAEDPPPPPQNQTKMFTSFPSG